MNSTTGETEPILATFGLSKSYGALKALDRVSVAFNKGEVHAVLGENGAGKSTLMLALSGFLTLDSGQVTYKGAPLPVGRPFECRRLGIGMIHQHFTLAGNLTVWENLAMTRLPSLASVVSPAVAAESAIEMGKRLDWDVDGSAQVKSLPVGAQQRVEILKSLDERDEVVIFDEPTAPLSPSEVDNLLQAIRKLAASGKAVILIAHKLSEVLAVADRVTVLRKGVVVGSALASEVDAETLAVMMVGENPPIGSAPNREFGPEILGVQGLSVAGPKDGVAVDDVTFSVRGGEVFGIGGVDGNGQLELSEAIAGVRAISSGTINSPVVAKVGFVPGDRRREGLALGMTVQDNLLVGAIGRAALRAGPFLKSRSIFRWAGELISRYSIKAESPFENVDSLSGGNQQKVVVSRVLDRKPDLIVVANPTRGLDVKAAAFVHDQLRLAASTGAAVVLISSDLDELTEMANRTAFMSKGRLLEGQDALSVVGGR